MSTLIKTYHRLLIDIVKLSKVPLGIPENITMNWVLIEGPSLDKKMLRWLENSGCSANSVLNEPEFPEWLAPLWQRFLEKQQDPFILKLLRQALVFGYKASFEPTNQQIQEAQASFENTDLECGVFNDSIRFNTPFWRLARAIVSRVIGDIRWHDIVPFHGPGAVFPPQDPVDRSNFNTIIDDIETFYPYWEYFKGLPGFYPSAFEILDTDITQQSSPIKAKLVAVPKDSRGPRLICVHPRESIWIQQGQRFLLERAIKKQLGHLINFDDQTVNGNLALRSSLDQAFSTLDLKDASDRLGCSVVSYLLGSAYDILSCTRAKEVQLLDGRVIVLKKWAPMGNALCFPIESLCFFAVVQAGIWTTYGSNAGWCSYVFGDDILVPSELTDGAIVGLKRAGLITNPDKCFRWGFFRESCGVDAFKGFNVTPHRMKTHRYQSNTDLVSLCSLAKNLRVDEFEEAASSIYSYVSRIVGRLTLSNNRNASGIYEYVDRGFDYLLRYEPTLTWSETHHVWKTRCPQVRAKTVRENGGWNHLLDSLLSLERRTADPSMSRGDPTCNTGLRYPVPSRQSLKKGWIPAMMS